MEFLTKMIEIALPLILGGGGITAVIVKEIIKNREANNGKLDGLANGISRLNTTMELNNQRLENLEKSYIDIKCDIRALQQNKEATDRKIDDLAKESRDGDRGIMDAIQKYHHNGV